jgi:hypothetical protein
MRRAEEHPERGRSPRGTVACAPGQAAGAVAGRGRSMMARPRVARATVMARQDVGGVCRVMRRRGIGRRQRQAPQRQTRQEQGEEPTSWAKGSAYHHGADLTPLGERQSAPYPCMTR